MRHYKLYLKDILFAIEKIEKYTKGLSHFEFKKNSLVIDGVVRNLEIIGEASKKLPTEIKNNLPDIEWKKMTGLRDILIHEYFGIDKDIVWDIIQNKLPSLKKKISELMKSKANSSSL
jgi:uncharacterized protein with HEPN domain